MYAKLIIKILTKKFFIYLVIKMFTGEIKEKYRRTNNKIEISNKINMVLLITYLNFYYFLLIICETKTEFAHKL